jgi:hypothetical protein
MAINLSLPSHEDSGNYRNFGRAVHSPVTFQLYGLPYSVVCSIEPGFNKETDRHQGSGESLLWQHNPNNRPR